MRPYILSETNWKTVKDTVYDVAILPWGATEAHNYHLPYGTDIIEAESIASASAKMAWEKGVIHHDDVLFFSYQLIKKHSLYMKNGEWPVLKLTSWIAMISKWLIGIMI